MQCTDMKVKELSPCATKGWIWALFLTSLILLALALHYTNIAGSRLVIEYVEAIGKLYWLGVGSLLGAGSRPVIESVEAIGKLCWLGVGFLLGATSYLVLL